MAATCASCRKPIRNGHKIALSGSEVFHRECAMGGTTESVGNKLRARALELQAELDRKTSDLERVRSELDNVRRINTDAHKENDRLAGIVRFREIEIRTAEHRVETAVEHSIRVANRERQTQADLALAIRERDAARTQVALLETLSRNVHVTPETSTVVTAADDHKDASEIRFSLLELDKP